MAACILKNLDNLDETIKTLRIIELEPLKRYFLVLECVKWATHLAQTNEPKLLLPYLDAVFALDPSMAFTPDECKQFLEKRTQIRWYIRMSKRKLP